MAYWAKVEIYSLNTRSINHVENMNIACQSTEIML